MAHHPAHYDLGESSVIQLPYMNTTIPAWQFFLTLEFLLLSGRFIAIQMSKEKAPFSIPAVMKPAMIHFGLNPSFYETLLGSIYGYYEMYDTLMRDLYLVIVIMGLSVCISAVAQHVLQICM